MGKTVVLLRMQDPDKLTHKQPNLVELLKTKYVYAKILQGTKTNSNLSGKGKCITPKPVRRTE